MRALLYVAGAFGFAAASGHYFIAKKVEEKTFPEMAFYYREIQSNYNTLNTEFAKLDKAKENFKDIYNNGGVSMMAFHYDNPMWIVDQSKARTAIGFSATKDLSAADRAKVGAGFSSVNLPQFRALTIPAKWCHYPMLYNLYLAILMRKYFTKYHQVIKDKKVAHVPVGGLYSPKGSVLFVPLPTEAKQFFDFIKTPEPALNETGKNYMAKLFETTPKTEPTAVTPATQQPAKQTEPAQKK